MKPWRHLGAGRVLSALDDLRASYWFLPSVMAVGGAVAAVLLIAIDRAYDEAIVRLLPWIAQTGPDGTRAVLSVIAGSMITVTGVVFSITVVSLTLASSQFGPRLLRNFLRDRANQLAFGTFVATFLFSLIVLRSVREDTVPHVASTVAVLLATCSLFVLIYFIHHTASTIQASSVIGAVADEIDGQLTTFFPERLGSGQPEDADGVDRLIRDVTEDGRDIPAPRDGFIRVVDRAALLDIVQTHDLRLRLDHRPGEFVFEGRRLARVGPTDRVSDDVAEAVAGAIVIGDLRSAVQDISLLIGQLTEVAVRALSPGVNDPHTAIECIRRLGALLATVATREMPARARADDDGVVRVLAPATTFDEVVGACLDPIRRYGAGHISVVLALLDVVGEAGRGAERGRRETLARQLQDVRAAFDADGRHSERDRALVEDAHAEARGRLEVEE